MLESSLILRVYRGIYKANCVTHKTQQKMDKAVSVGKVYIKQGENHGTTMILDGVSYSAFIHLCRVILSRMMDPTVVSL